MAFLELNHSLSSGSLSTSHTKALGLCTRLCTGKKPYSLPDAAWPPPWANTIPRNSCCSQGDSSILKHPPTGMELTTITLQSLLAALHRSLLHP